MTDLKCMVIPHYKELSLQAMYYDWMEKYPAMLGYFPDYLGGQLPTRKFFWDVYSTLHYQEVAELVERHKEEHYEEHGKKDKLISIRPEIFEKIKELKYSS